ncbi:MAG: adenosylcobalamin-dependent ribonucleoside-diphosphate reductase [Pseudomonadota bacterium]
MNNDPFSCDISRHIWDAKYRYRDAGKVKDATVEDTWRRVARALAGVEADGRTRWERRFYTALEDFRFLPGGRILAGAGTGHRVTLFNCFVMGRIEDSLDGIFDALKEGALTMQQGGGVGYDFSTLRPAGTPAAGVGVTASGPVSFMHIWDAMCATILSTGARRGAMMATLRCDHPDIFEFVRAKRDPAKLRHFNLSVLVSDAFMQAIRQDADWPLAFPAAGEPGSRVYRIVRARELWNEIMAATYDYAEPGVLFIDRINALNNLWYAERLAATNPCGEIPLPPYGACDLGSLNLTRFVRAPFESGAALDFAALEETTAFAVRMLDNVCDLSRFPLERQAQAVRATRRIGLGFTGLGNALIMLGLRYDSAEARQMASGIMQRICETAYRTSIELAREKGSFPLLNREKHLQGEFIRNLPQDIRSGIAQHGIRNSHLTAIAPTGTISLLANNVSSGLEPVFQYDYRRRIHEMDGQLHEYAVSDYAYALYRRLRGADAPLTPAFVTAGEISPFRHLDMQAALQPWVDNAISKTINIPADYAFEEFQSIYQYAHEHGLKGCTTYRPNPVTGQVLVQEPEAASHCCSVEREAD